MSSDVAATRSPRESRNSYLRLNSPTTNEMALKQAEHAASSAPLQKETSFPTSPSQLRKEHTLGADSSRLDESNAARVERLGRQRPEAFASIWSEVGFVFSIAMSQVLSVLLPVFHP